jgi:hypothetical protein
VTCSPRTRLAQLILVDPQAARVLLACHKTGEMEGVYTGLLDTVEGGEKPQEAVVRIARDLAGIRIRS